MSKKNIIVPQGMLDAASCPCGVVDYEGLRRTLEAALLWLRKNPVAPTSEQALALRKLALEVNSGYINDGQISAASCHAVVVEYQRVMFLAPPEPNPVVTTIKQALQGVTLTAGDAVELMDAVRRCTSPEPESSSGGSYTGHRTNKPESLAPPASPDPELKVLWDLLQSAPGEDDERDRQIIEAFRRGQRSKECPAPDPLNKSK